MHRRLFGIFFLIAAQLLVAINIVSSKSIVHDLPIMLLLTIRFFLAAALILPLHWLTPARKLSIHNHFSTLTKKDVYFLVAQALSAGALFNCFMLLGLHFTDANIAGIITSTLPAIIAIMSWIILKEKISGKKIVCVIFATIGLLVIAGEKITNIGQSHSFLGDFLILLSLFPEATYYVLCKLHTPKMPVFLASSLMNLINAMVLLPYVLWQGFNLSIPLHDWYILILLGFNTALFYVFWYFGSKRVDGPIASISTAVMPVATVFFAWLFLNEDLSQLETLGMGLVLFSIFVYARN